MKITNLSVKPLTLSLNQDFKIAHSTSIEYQGVLIKIETDERINGFGEAVPSKRVTGETPGTVLKILENIVKPVILDKDPTEITKIMDEVNSAILYNTSAKAAVDIALHDILGKYAQLPLCKLFGEFRNEITTSITIGIKGIKKTMEEADKLIQNGARVLKVKIGLDVREDVEKIRILREEIGNEIKIRVDANQGYTPSEAIQVLRQIEKYDIEFMEQPLPYWDIEGLKRVKNKSGVPIMADESLHSAHDAISLIRAGACDLFNIKLMKSGGILEAKKVAAVAEAAGIPCMLGCMVETKIGIAAATHLALSLKNVKYADLDGHLSLKEDVVQGGVITENGTNKVTTHAGLGIKPVSRLLE